MYDMCHRRVSIAIGYVSTRQEENIKVVELFGGYSVSCGCKAVGCIRKVN
jgi:hypothetical protein